MNVVIEDNSQKNKKLKIFYISILVICVISVIAAIILQITGTDEETPSNKEVLPGLTAGQISEYKENFDSIFTNEVNYLKNNSYKITKVKQEEEIIYLGYKNKDKKTNDYELDVNIPYININDATANEMNTQIKDIFEKKAKSILNTQNNNVIYTVNYSAFLSNNILSLVVRSTLKEGNNPQRDIVQTYNYDLTNHKKCSIDAMLEMRGITKKQANEQIKNEIRNVQKTVEELAKMGYTIYPRDYTNDIYSINNVTEYFMGENNAIYVIYAYGNLNHTSEMDVVIM